MLAIRMQRTGRKGHAQFRVVVQDSRQAPTSGRVVASLGSYNPHTKVATLDKEKATFYLTNGAQPSDRAARLLQKEGVKLPEWVTLSTEGKRETRNPEKLRKNQPATPAEEATDTKAEEAAAPEEPTEAAESAGAPAEKAQTADTVSDEEE